MLLPTHPAIDTQTKRAVTMAMGLTQSVRSCGARAQSLSLPRSSHVGNGQCTRYSVQEWAQSEHKEAHTMAGAALAAMHPHLFGHPPSVVESLVVGWPVLWYSRDKVTLLPSRLSLPHATRSNSCTRGCGNFRRRGRHFGDGGAAASALRGYSTAVNFSCGWWGVCPLVGHLSVLPWVWGPWVSQPACRMKWVKWVKYCCPGW